ncbi:hypothetical protein HZS_5257 [Henneguya salminicola]|nr:hypothetical protein HZS_5257 [Henneguya salminicola]
MAAVNIIERNINCHKFYSHVVHDDISARKFCLTYGLIASSRVCRICDSQYHLIMDSSTSDGCIWRCKNNICKKKTSIRHHSWFSNSRLSIPEILIIAYMWYTKENQSDIDFELRRPISTRKIFFILIDTGVDWYRTTFISDGWAAYMNISSIPGYRYPIVVSTIHKISRILQLGAHTNSVEENWRWARTFMPVTGTRKGLYSSSLLDYPYRNPFLGGCNSRSYDIFLSHILQI